MNIFQNIFAYTVAIIVEVLDFVYGRKNISKFLQKLSKYLETFDER